MCASGAQIGAHEIVESLCSGFQIRFVNDVVAVEHATSLVTCHLHGHTFRYSRSQEIPHGGPPEIVDYRAGDPGVFTASRPDPLDTFDLNSVSMKDPRADLAVFFEALKNDLGNGLTVDLNGETVACEKKPQIPVGPLRILESDGEGDFIRGSATVSSDQALAGVIVFSGTTEVAGVGSSFLVLKSFVTPMENRDDEQPGIAIMNVEREAVQLGVCLRGENNETLATASLELPALGHRALFVFQFDWTPEAGVTVDLSDFKRRAHGRVHW